MIKDMFGNTRYKIGLHIHTNISDGCVSPEESARIYKEAGFDAIAITDHWKYHGEDEISGLKIISGCEYNLGGGDTTDCVMHIVGVGMDYNPEINMEKASRQGVIDAINKTGGLAVLAHPAWSLNSPKHALELCGFGATEIYNTVSECGQSDRAYSGYFVDLMANEGITYPLLATDDTHYYDGNDETKAFIMVKANSLDKNEILSAIRKCDFYATMGPEIHIERKEDKIVCRCSECVKIVFHTSSAWCPDRVYKGEKLTQAEYTVKNIDKWVRAEVTDKDGKRAWSNIIRVRSVE